MLGFWFYLGWSLLIGRIHAEPAAQIGNEVINDEQLLYGIKNEVFELEEKIYQMKMDRLRALLLEKFLQADPRKGKLTNDQFLQQFIAPNLQVSVAEIEEFITTKQIPPDQVNGPMRERVKNFLLQGKRKQAVDHWLDEQIKNHAVKINLIPPVRPTFQVPVSSDDPSWGKGPVEVIMITDFQCPFSAKGAKILAQLQAKYGEKKIKVVIKNFPLPFHSQAPLTAEVALCGYQQNQKKFWSLAEDFYTHQNNLAQTELLAMAKKRGFRTAKIEECLAKKTMAEKVKKDQAQLVEVGIKLTPTFLINSKVISGAVNIEQYTQLIDQELARPK